jgi:KAP-like P-loop domain-containing protein
MKSWISKILSGVKAKTIGRNVAPAADSAESARTHSGSGGAHQAVGYSSDQPIRSRTEDRFARWPFAERIALTLATRQDPASLVIGLFGPWGDGKSSTLHLMEEALASHQNVVVVRFNPWLFQSEERLLSGFFATLAQSIGRSLPSRREEFGKLLKRYGAVLSLASISLGGAIHIRPGDAAKGLGETLSTVELDELRRRLETFLEESGKRVVILIDDIDRLDRGEIQAIFKLVRLSASFNRTAYVLAFDDEMVAAAIGERYGAGGHAAGRSFLEKIIQVPLHLPPPDEISLRKVTFTGIEGALELSGISLSQEQVDAFVRHFVDGIEPQLHTPRHSKLYANALMFALPLLKGEVHPVDLMLVEGIRAFYPNLYMTIRDNPEYFLKSGPAGEKNEEHRKRAAGLIDKALDGMAVQDKGQVRSRLLEVLFPRLRKVEYGGDGEKEWAREQRICSEQYFTRYFTYSVPPGDISDVEITKLLEGMAGMDTAGIDNVLKSVAERSAMPKFVRKVRNQENGIGAPAARQLALALARNGSQLPREKGMLTSDWTFEQGAILTAHLLARVAAGQEREALAVEIMRSVQPIPFGFEILRWIRHDQGEPEADRLLSAQAEETTMAELCNRIREQANKSPLYHAFGGDAPKLYWIWSKCGAAGEVATHLRSRFEAYPTEVDNFLDAYVGYSWGLESGLPRRSELRRESYDAIGKLLDVDVIVANLKQRYGAELNAPEYYHGDDVPLPRRIAHQFVFIHMKVQEERAKTAAA